MKKNFLFFYAVVASLIISSCTGLLSDKPETLSDDEFNPITINDEYRMNVPKYMKKTSNLNDEASLQFQNIFKETYVIVIDEDKDLLVSTFTSLGEYDDSLSVVENYRNIQMQFLSEGIQSSMVSDPSAMKINGLDAQTVEIDGMVEGVDQEVSYFLTFIEGKEKVYMLMAWTLKKEREKYKNTFGQISRSFSLVKEL